MNDQPADIAALTKRSHDTGFEQGSIAAANAILAYLSRTGHPDIAADVLAAWNGGTLVEPEPEPTPTAIAPTNPATEIGAGKTTREEARSQGFTGDSCMHCGSMKMQIAGHCMVCAECGTTTGCS